MNEQLEFYQQFIDAMVRNSKREVTKAWITTDGYPKLEDNEEVNQLLAKLSAREKQVIAQLVQDGANGAIHDALVYLQEETDLAELKISKDGVNIAVEPYGTTMYYDFVCRREGDEWPDGELDEKYK